MPARPRGFAEWNPRGETLELVTTVQSVLDEYRQYLPLTVRQIFYRLVANHGYEKTERGYLALQEKLVRARRAQLISFGAIRDDGFYRTSLYSVEGVQEALAGYREMAGRERLDRQAGQERPLIVWCEARGMAQMLEGVTRKYGIPVMTSGGFDSVTTQHDLGRELAATDGLILHLGDYDASGTAMFTALEENIVSFANSYGGLPTLERIAITPDQIDAYQLPTAPPKSTDKRGAFTDSRTVQLEAFSPDELLDVLETAIQSRFDMDTYYEVLDAELGMREELLERLSA